MGFSAKQRRVTANVVVPASELAEHGSEALATHFDVLAGAVARRVAPGRADGLGKVLGGAFRAAVLA
ncbi:hypothetical protein [Cellulomonas sp. URHB0016]